MPIICLYACAVICQSLSPLPNGTISYSDLPRVVGSVASHSYDTGYILNGETTRTCQRDGTWSGAAPTCQGNHNFISSVYPCLSTPNIVSPECYRLDPI